MKPTYTYKKSGIPVTILKIEFKITSNHIEVAIAHMMEFSEKINKSEVEKYIRDYCHSGGQLYF